MPWVLDQLAAMFGLPFQRANAESVDGRLVLGDRSGLWAAELAQVPAQWLTFGLNRYRERIRDEARGGEKCWPPTATQFAVACEPTTADLGLPSPEALWQQACDRCRSPQSLCELSKAASSGLIWDIQNASSPSAIDAVRRRFMAQYRGVVNRIAMGEPVQAVAMLEQPKAELRPSSAVAVIDLVELTPEQQQYAAELRAKLRNGRAA